MAARARAEQSEVEEQRRPARERSSRSSPRPRLVERGEAERDAIEALIAQVYRCARSELAERGGEPQPPRRDANHAARRQMARALAAWERKGKPRR